MNDIKKFYDLNAEKCAEQWYPNNVLLPTIKDFLFNFNDSPKILDLGCGTGHESMRLHSLGAEVVGVDFSEESIRIAKKKTPQCTFLAKDILELDKSLGLFDGIFSSGSIIHISEEQMPKLFRILYNLLEDGGFIEIITQDGQGKRIDIFKDGDKIYDRMIYLYSFEKLDFILSQYSFRFVREGFLDKKIYNMNWRCYIFQKR